MSFEENAQYDLKAAMQRWAKRQPETPEDDDEWIDVQIIGPWGGQLAEATGNQIMTVVWSASLLFPVSKSGVDYRKTPRKYAKELTKAIRDNRHERY